MKSSKGWFFESRRHALASKGIKTGRKQRLFMRDSDRDGVPDKDDCAPFDPNQQAFIENIKEHISHYYNLSKEQVHHLVEEIKENAPKAWAWLKEREHQLEDKFYYGIQKFKTEHPLHSSTSAEIIDHIEDKHQENGAEVLDGEGDIAHIDYEIESTPLEVPEVKLGKKKKGKFTEKVDSILEKGAEYLAKRRATKEMLQKELDMLSDDELRAAAVAFKPSVSLFALTPETNPYEQELLRRVAKSKQIDEEIAKIRKSKRENGQFKGGNGYSLVDYLIGRDIWDKGKEKRKG